MGLVHLVRGTWRGRMRFKLLAVAWLQLLACPVAGQEELWTAVEDSAGKARVLTEAQHRIRKGLTFKLNHDLLAWNKMYFNKAGSIFMQLPIPSGELVRFELFSTNVLHPEAQAKYNIHTFSGHSVDFDRVLTANVDWSIEGGFGAYIVDEGDRYYIDPYHHEDRIYKVHSSRSKRVVSENHAHAGASPQAKGTTPHLYGERQAAGADSGHWGCGLKVPEDRLDDGQPSLQMRSRGGVASSSSSRADKQFTFTLALIANGEYSKYHGNRKSSVMAAFVRLVNRINGIYSRELGVFFQLHKDTDDLICEHPCKELSNSGNILYEAKGFVQKRGISLDSIDLGHSLTTGSGGMAWLKSLCGSWKVGGTTGLPAPESDFFYVDYVAHEIGHQLNGRHSFSDCNGWFESPLKRSSTPVEPGSGSTIMSYAGLCGHSNVASRVEPIFHAKNIEEMKDFLHGVTANGNCGRVESHADSAPRTKMVSTCSVPAGSYFQLGILDPQDDELFYSIDTVDVNTVRQEYPDRAVPRFRSWVPTHRPYRNFPNLYYIIHNQVDSVKDEIVPRTAKTMTFRGMTRSLYSHSGDARDAGSSTFQDLAVRFTATKPLKIVQEVHDEDWISGGRVTIRWDAGETEIASPRVEIAVAVHEPAMDYAGTKRIDYSSQIAALNWVSLGEYANTGVAAGVRVPSFRDEKKGTPESAHDDQTGQSGRLLLF